MGKFIVKLEDYYFEWSTIVDSPITFGMSLEDFLDYYRVQYGRKGLNDLPGRLKRVEEYGSSAYQKHYWLPDLFSGNRAGPDESELTKDEIFKAYCLMKSIQDGWKVPIVEYMET